MRKVYAVGTTVSENMGQGGHVDKAVVEVGSVLFEDINAAIELLNSRNKYGEFIVEFELHEDT